MRVLLAQNMRYLPSHGGANKSNRIMLEGLAARGHRCVAVAPLHATEHRMSEADLVAHLVRLGAPPPRRSGDALVFEHRGVQVHVVTEPARLAPYARQLTDALQPDRTLVPSDDPGLLMLGTALRASPDRVVYLVHTLQQVPFGPRTFYPGASGLRLVRRCAGVVAVSRAARDYAVRWGGLDPALIYPPVYGPGPHPDLGRPDSGAVTMINPCGYKGVSVLLGLADARPEVRFLAVPTWGTTDADRTELARRPNIEVADPVDDIVELLRRTRVLLMPSLWDETFGYAAVEAMLHGIPVLASDVGGLTEAKLGVPYLLPVRPISEYRPQRDDEPYPAPVVPPQDLDPWLAALDRLLGEPEHYRDIATRGRRVATDFAGRLDPAELEHYLSNLDAPATPGPVTAEAGIAGAERVARLSPERRAALVKLAARRAGARDGAR
ncbi:glycosyltransferase family 4 protein [Rhizomonospora bruguierae]|uniref:glycosyltransferase family 4 protein n=1 Tax=Rhizomonospora bruguierae TaxID=1581705 RepID=UPI0020C10882|nr:glycosyltransferase family 4 protein [Micromonospora sp. NBRC 107566]